MYVFFCSTFFCTILSFLFYAIFFFIILLTFFILSDSIILSVFFYYILFYSTLFYVILFSLVCVSGIICYRPSSLSHLGLSDGCKQAAYLSEDGHSQFASAGLAGAQQQQGQTLHSVQHRGVRTAIGRQSGAPAALRSHLRSTNIHTYT